MQSGDLLRLGFDYGTTNNNGNVLNRQEIPSRPREGLCRSCGCHQNLALPSFSVTQTSTYDAYNRIQKVEEGSNHRDFQYKEPGNMYVPSSQGTGWAPGSFTPTSPSWFDEKNRLVNPLLGIQYDEAGNLTAIGGFTFAYDAENRLVSSTLNSVTTTYAYDGEGRRVKKGSVVMVYDAFGRLAAEYGGTADPVGTEYLTADHLGSTRLVTSAAGAERRCLDYLPFGEQMTQGMGTRGACYASATEPRVKFTGKERDAETALDYFLARYYSAAQGRFTSPDEFQGGIVDPFTGQQVGAPGPLPYADITDPQTLNKYAYVRNNPLRYTDPDGHVIDYLLDAAGIAFDLNEIRKNPSIGNFVQLGADVVLAAVPFVPTIGAMKAGAKAVELGTDVARAGERGILAVERGRQAEKAVLEAEGLVKNTKAIQAVDPKTGKVATTIPDAIRASGQTVEVKDVKRLSDSPQLRRQAEISRAAGQRGQVITGTNTKVSETVQRRMEVRRRKELGPDEP